VQRRLTPRGNVADHYWGISTRQRTSGTPGKEGKAANSGKGDSQEQKKHHKPKGNYAIGRNEPWKNGKSSYGHAEDESGTPTQTDLAETHKEHDS